jgi:GNAT superfamily N-acetyltransferase
MITIREATTDADLEAWRQVRLAVLPHERALTVAEMRVEGARDPDRLLLLAELDGELAGSGLAGRSQLGGAGLHPRVLPSHRRRGVGSALYEALERYARERGFTEAGSMVDDEVSLAFALARGCREVDRQIEQVRELDGTGVSPAPRDDVEVVSIAERPDLLEAAYPLAVEAYADLATIAPVTVTLEEWLEDEATQPSGSFVALSDGEVVGYSGLLADPDHRQRAEDGLTAVRRDWRRRGLATHLKRLELAWAATNGIRLVYTWTQRGNDGMRAVNERLGYTTRQVCTVLRKGLA